MKYVREITGRDDGTLKKIIRDNDFSNLKPNKNFLDDYDDNTIRQREPFTIDSSELHTFIVNLIFHNE